MRGGFAEVLRYSYDVAPLRCVDMPTRLQITAFFFIRAIVTRKTEQSFRKTGQKKPARGVRAGLRERGARRCRGAGRVLDVCIIKVMRVVGRDVRSAELPIWQSIGGRVERGFIGRVVKDCIRAQPVAFLVAA